MNPEIFIEIVICTYNNARLLDRALAAISEQTVTADVRWQVLVVNNNCTDETSKVVETHSKQSRVPLREIYESEQGLTPARVCGAKNTTAEWIAFVDDDCLLAANWVEQAARFALEHPEGGGFSGKIILEWEQPPPSFVLNHPYAYAGANHGDAVKRREWLAGAGMVVRKRALEATGWLEKQFLEDRIGKWLVSGGDVEISMRIAARHEVWYNPACQLRHVIPPRRTTREYLRRMVFGLGASRHNSNALKWSGSYFGWLLYSSVYSIGFLGFGLSQLIRNALSGADFDVVMAVNPALGWWLAMRRMLRMNSAERRKLLGCAVKRHDPAR